MGSGTSSSRSESSSSPRLLLSRRFAGGFAWAQANFGDYIIFLIAEVGFSMYLSIVITALFSVMALIGGSLAASSSHVVGPLPPPGDERVFLGLTIHPSYPLLELLGWANVLMIFAFVA